MQLTLLFKGLNKGEAPPPPPPAPEPRTPSEEERAESVGMDIQGLNISEVSNNRKSLNLFSLVVPESNERPGVSVCEPVFTM